LRRVWVSCQINAIIFQWRYPISFLISSIMIKTIKFYKLVDIDFHYSMYTPIMTILKY
jgi:hypothetical protein